MDVFKLYNKANKFPFGKNIFSFFAAQGAPYFSSIKPMIVTLEKGKAIATMKDRRRVRNHLKTVHAIALCNLCEFTMGMVALATNPSHIRWIPKGMTVEYKKKAKGTMLAIAKVKESDFQVGDMTITVDVFDKQNVNVMSADIVLYVSEIKN